MLMTSKLGEFKLSKKQIDSVNFETHEQKPKAPKPKIRKRVKPKAKPRKSLAPSLSQGISGASFGIKSLEIDFTGNNSEFNQGKERVMDENSVDELPTPIKRSNPQYPGFARKQGLSGEVSLSLLINSKGEVDKVKVLKSSPQGIFEEAALSCVKRWSFEPARYQGEPVAIWIEQKIRFDLN